MLGRQISSSGSQHQNAGAVAQARHLVLDVLPAQEGDALLLALPGRGRTHHVLIDAGTPSTAPVVLERLKAIPDRRLDLVVVTHIDSDHIAGMAKLLASPAFDLQIDDVWLNGHRHLPKPANERGVADAERLTAILTGDTAARKSLPWNQAFGGKVIVRDDVPASSGSPLPVIELPWGLRLTILSPTMKKLADLRKDWDRYVSQLHRGLPSAETEQPARVLTRGLSLQEAALRETKDDAAPPNGSSIAFLAEFGGRSLLFGADAHPDALVPALKMLALSPGKQLIVDVLKLPHHGSCANVTLDLLEAVRAEHYVVSTSGRRFQHPDEEAMARVLTRGRSTPGARPTLWFNYASDTTARWLDPQFAERHKYVAVGPSANGKGISISLDCMVSRRGSGDPGL